MSPEGFVDHWRDIPENMPRHQDPRPTASHTYGPIDPHAMNVAFPRLLAQTNADKHESFKDRRMLLDDRNLPERKAQRKARCLVLPSLLVHRLKQAAADASTIRSAQLLIVEEAHKRWVIATAIILAMILIVPVDADCSSLKKERFVRSTHSFCKSPKFLDNKRDMLPWVNTDTSLRCLGTTSTKANASVEDGSRSPERQSCLMICAGTTIYCCMRSPAGHIGVISSPSIALTTSTFARPLELFSVSRASPKRVPICLGSGCSEHAPLASTQPWKSPGASPRSRTLKNGHSERYVKLKWQLSLLLQLLARSFWSFSALSFISAVPFADAAPLPGGPADKVHSVLAYVHELWQAGLILTPYLVVLVGVFFVVRTLVKPPRPGRPLISGTIAFGSAFAWWVVRCTEHMPSTTEAIYLTTFAASWTNFVAYSCRPLEHKMEYVLSMVIGGGIIALLISALAFIAGQNADGPGATTVFFSRTYDISPGVLFLCSLCMHLWRGPRDHPSGTKPQDHTGHSTGV